MGSFGNRKGNNFRILTNKILLNCGAIINTQDKMGNTPLQDASRFARKDLVEFFVGEVPALNQIVLNSSKKAVTSDVEQLQNPNI